MSDMTQKYKKLMKMLDKDSGDDARRREATHLTPSAALEKKKAEWKEEAEAQARIEQAIGTLAAMPQEAFHPRTRSERATNRDRTVSKLRREQGRRKRRARRGGRGGSRRRRSRNLRRRKTRKRRKKRDRKVKMRYRRFGRWRCTKRVKYGHSHSKHHRKKRRRTRRR